MDQNARLARVEAFVETFREELDRLHAADERLANEIAQLREHMDRGFAEARQHTDQGLEQLRKELSTTTRWLVGLMLANTSLTLGTLGLVLKSMGML
jgi:uncharacterized protein (DUF885 family)